VLIALAAFLAARAVASRADGLAQVLLVLLASRRRIARAAWLLDAGARPARNQGARRSSPRLDDCDALASLRLLVD